MCSLTRHPGQVRNLCILAHVDHGKTTLADALVASNGLISQRMAGTLRYMDSRPDEQERGITMKASAVTLTFTPTDRDEPYLIHLIDSPGHVDFSSEVSTAVRLCDGALLVVDVVESVQAQTKLVLQQAWQEGIRPVLVLNKIDRLILERKLTPLEAYLQLSQVLEQVNAVIAELYTAEVMSSRWQQQQEQEKSKSEAEVASKPESASEEVFDDWSSGLADADDSHLYFSPEQGNVVFASAYDGWAFDLDQFARIYSQKLGFSRNVLTKTLWGNFYVNLKAKKIMKGALGAGKKPLFVQLILDNIWAVYDAAMERKDKDKLLKIAESLQLKVAARDLRSVDCRQHLKTILSQWLPLAPTLLNMACAKLPAANELTPSRVEKLMCATAQRFDTLPMETQKLKQAFLDCSSEDDAPVIVFVSKMFPVPRGQLPENRPKSLTPEEIAERRERARQRLADRDKESQANKDDPVAVAGEKLAEMQLDREKKALEEKQRANETTFVAFARVFSGKLKPGQSLYVLGPKYDPAAALARRLKGEDVCNEALTVRDYQADRLHIMKATVDHLYLLLGRDLQEMPAAPAGSVIGIGGLEDYVLKSATVSDQVACPPFVEMARGSVPILRNAIEPAISSDMNKMVKGLHLLNQADANVQVVLTDKGEHVLVTAGEVHLERCLRDLKETYARVEVVASAPIVPFRETVVKPPKTDMVNEQLNDENRKISAMAKDGEEGEDGSAEKEVIEIKTANKKCSLKIRAVPLPEEATKLLDESADLFLAMDKEASDDLLAASVLTAREELRKKLAEALSGEELLADAVDKIWTVGPKKCGPNILINEIDWYQHRPSIWTKGSTGSHQNLFDYDSSVINGFQLATLAGPLCEEPLMGVAFVVSECVLAEYENGDSDVYGPMSGQLVSAVKEGCRRAFQAQPQRLMAAMYTCDVQVKAEVLGKLFAFLGKRHGKVVKEDMLEGSSTFTVTAHLPVIESFSSANDLRRQTSGLALPQLVFSHWEVVDVDPFWVPETEEEILHFGDKADFDNRARKYMNDVRKKKGLAVDEKIVEFAEKQRTLGRSK